MFAAQIDNPTEGERDRGAESTSGSDQPERLPFQDLHVPPLNEVEPEEVDSATILERRTIGRTLEQLADSIFETRVKFDKFDKHFAASTKAMNGPFIEGAAWFCGGLASMVAIQQLSLPLTPQLPFYLALGIGAARFFWRLAKEARPSGMAATLAKEEYNAAYSRKEGLARRAGSALQIKTQRDEYGIEQDEDAVGAVLRGSLQYVTPLIPGLAHDGRQVVEGALRCGERLGGVIVPHFSKRRQQLEEISNGYNSDRARLIRAIGRYLQDPERYPPVTVTHALRRLSQHAASLDAILVKNPK
jgi:hypothetical protein